LGGFIIATLNIIQHSLLGLSFCPESAEKMIFISRPNKAPGEKMTTQYSCDDVS
jgi:hypothetical protein